MAFRNISVLLSASSGNLRAVMAGAGQDVKKFEQQVESAGAGTSKFGSIVAGAAAVGAIGLAAGLAASTGAAIGFDRAMRNVNSISQVSERALGNLSKETLALSRDPFVNQGATTLAKGLYDIASSGFQGGQGLIVLRAAAEAASAGLTTTNVAGKAITATLNAYGRSALDAGDVSDVLFQTVNLGVVTFEELASQLGDVVGTAAAAKVPIEDVGAAIAAMTLSGVSAAESSTALNRVIQSFIAPSDAMAATLKKLGYESGAAALKQDGLYVVMRKLGQAAGGTLTGIQALFPEMRALKGALALTAAEGENYRKTQEGIANAETRAGATRRALSEQLKSAGVQLDKFKNSAESLAIAAGTKLLPGIIALLHGIENLGRSALPSINAAAAAAAPLFRHLGELGVNLADAVAAVASGLAPLAGMLAGLVGGAVLASLSALAAALAAVAKFAADHSGLLQLVAAMAALNVAASGVQLAIGLFSSALYGSIGSIGRVTSGLGGLIGSVGATGVAFGVAGLAATVVMLGVSSAIKNAQGNADKLVSSLLDGMPKVTNATNAADAVNATKEAFDRLNAAARGSNVQRLTQVIDPNEKNTILDALEGRNKLREANLKLDEQRRNAVANEGAISDATGASRQAVERYAAAVGIGLTGAYGTSSEARERAILGIKKLQSQTGLSASAINSATDGNIAKIEEFAKAVEDAGKKADTAFKTLDTFKGFKPTSEADQLDKLGKASDNLATARDRLSKAEAGIGKARESAADKVTSAAERVRDAEDKLASARERAAKNGATPAETRAVADAERDLARAKRDQAEKTTDVADAEKARADAVKDLSKAQADSAKAQSERLPDGEQLRRFFTDQQHAAETFAKGIAELLKRGLDPKLIQNLLEQGPKDAAPAIDALLSDHSNQLIGMANETQKQLTDVNETMIRFARVTAAAIRAPTDEIAAQAPLALKILGEQITAQGKLTADGLAAILNVPPDSVRAAATAYGLDINEKINTALNSKALVPPGFTVTPDGGLIPTNIASPDILRAAANQAGRAAAHGYDQTGQPGQPRHRAHGGISAGIATSETLVMGERGTGGEGFIPLGANQRSQSLNTWREVGRILGAGPTATPGRSQPWRGASDSGSTAGQTVNLTVAAPQDADIVRQAEYAARVAGWRLDSSGRR